MTPADEFIEVCGPSLAAAAKAGRKSNTVELVLTQPTTIRSDPMSPTSSTHLAGLAAQAANVDGRFVQRATVIARQLHVLADAVSAIVDDPFTDAAGGISRSVKAREVIDRVTQKLASLDLGDLAVLAAEADLLTAAHANLSEIATTIADRQTSG